MNWGRAKKPSKWTHNVEQILAKRYADGRPQLLLKWVGYPLQQSTWEPIENLSGDCLSMLADFEAAEFAKLNAQNRGSTRQQGAVDSSLLKQKMEYGKTQKTKQKKKQKKLSPKKKLDPMNQLNLSSDLCNDLMMSSDSSDNGISGSKVAANGTSHPNTIPTSGSKYATSASKEETKGVKQDKDKASVNAFAYKSGTSSISKSDESNIILEHVKGMPIRDHMSEAPAKTEGPAGGMGRWDDALNIQTRIQGLQRGLPLEKIVKVFKMRKEVYMMVKWKTVSSLDAVPINALSELYPHVVLEFFEQLDFCSDSE
ncbi:uncharacterized protein LOC115564854 [Drosophila navojoa]|uniref:uncharacterized protein LOC115564854 n=1 Tax=Drosophila navojoa TaxID=7232 RepID=UPI0011BF68F7|nr:uncharacterized protein LOC115564854 [Drosophila navojoa]